MNANYVSNVWVFDDVSREFGLDNVFNFACCSSQSLYVFNEIKGLTYHSTFVFSVLYMPIVSRFRADIDANGDLLNLWFHLCFRMRTQLCSIRVWKPKVDLTLMEDAHLSLTMVR